MNAFKQYKTEIIFAAVLVFLISWLVDPLNWFMPEFLQKPHLLIITVVFIFFASLIWKEHPKDEREEMIRLKIGRLSFLVGTASLIIGIFVERWTTGVVNLWLVLSLAMMLMAKILGSIYYNQKN